MLVVVAMLAAGCSVAKSSDDAEKEALARRVAELEQKLAQQSAAPAAVAEPAPVAAPVRTASRPQPAPVPVRPVTPEPEPVEPPIAPPPAAAPAPVAVRPTPLPVPPVVIAAGTNLELVLETALSSVTSVPGDRVVARIVQASDEGGPSELPGGSYLEGRVADARASGRVKGKALVDVAFDRIVVRGERHPIETSGLRIEADDSHKRDAAMVAGGAAAGAIIGAITGGSAKKGAVIGAAAGGGAVLATKGKEVELPAGTPASVRVTQERTLHPRR
jgi:hypothetical protein